MRGTALIGVACAALAVGPVALAQVAEGNDPVATLNSSSSLVVIPALVQKRSGELVYGLHAEDFVLTDDGVPQMLRLEEDSGGEPLALVVVIEAGAANRAAGWHPYTPGAPPDRFKGLPAMVEAMAAGVPHRIAVVGFDSQPELELEFTSNFDEVGEVIRQLSEANAGDHGAAIVDSLSFAVDLLRKAPPGYRRAILLLSETNDRGSKLPLEEAVRVIGETNTAIYSVAFSTGFHEASEYGNKELPTKSVPQEELRRQRGLKIAAAAESTQPAEMVATRIVQGVLFGVTLHNPNPGPAGGCMAADPGVDPALGPKMVSRGYDCLAQLAPPLGLAKLAMIAATGQLRRNVPETVARLTGGEYFLFNGAKSLEQHLATLANHVPNRYVLSFQPQSPHAGMHVVGLELKGYPQLRVTARSSYWAKDAGGTAQPGGTQH